jgi:hypothetical protein
MNERRKAIDIQNNNMYDKEKKAMNNNNKETEITAVRIVLKYMNRFSEFCSNEVFRSCLGFGIFMTTFMSFKTYTGKFFENKIIIMTSIIEICIELN